MKVSAAILGLPLFVSILLSGCLGSDDQAAPPSPTGTGGRGGMNGGNETEEKEMYTVATDISSQPETVFKFRPNTFSFKVGDAVNVTLKNAIGNQYSHNLIITELNVAIRGVPPTQAKSQVVTADKAGSFKFFCDVGNHRQFGMEGTVTIS